MPVRAAVFGPYLSRRMSPRRPTLAAAALAGLVAVSGDASARTNLNDAFFAAARAALAHDADGQPPSAPAGPPPGARASEATSIDAGIPAQSGWRYLAPARTFEALTADPRWPAFTAFYRFQSGGRFLDEYEAISFGDSIALARGPIELFGRDLEFETGVQGAVFAAFNPHSPSQDLINADYAAGAFASLRDGPWSAMFRYWHISGHVGDEFLLRDEIYPGATRVNFKFDSFQLLVSRDLPGGLRAYGGPALMNAEPSAYTDFLFQAGLEWHPSVRLLGRARPVVAADVKTFGESELKPDLSVRAGFSIDAARRSPALQLLGEAYVGRDPNGQFFDDNIVYYGVGVQIRL